MSAVSSRLFGWPIGISIAVHAVAIVTAASVGALTPEAAPPAPLPIEVVRLDPPTPPPPKPKPPRHEPKPVRQEPKPQPQEKIVAPRLVSQPAELAQPEPLPAAPLFEDAPRKALASGIAAESSESSRRVLAGAAASSSWSVPGAPRGSAAPAGKLFSTGDLPMPGGNLPIPPGRGGTGGTAQGRDVASTGDATRDIPGDTKGLTSLARPLGGYQTRPRYPDSARREGVEGETLLRFQVLTSGRVASVSVARTAGHPDLDRAAVDAVTAWLFEPARRGKEAVSVWVTLPVRFQLDVK